MFLRVACLYLYLGLVAAQDPTKAIKIQAIRPGDAASESQTLEVLCTFDKSRSDFRNLQNVEIYGSALGEQKTDLVAALARSGVTYGLSESEIHAIGLFSNGVRRKSELEVHWLSEEAGYCQAYTCKVTGQLANGQTQYLTRNIKVRAPDGTPCGKKQNQQQVMTSKLEEKIEQCCVSSHEVQTNANLLKELVEDVSNLSEKVSAVEKSDEELEELSEQVKSLHDTSQVADVNSGKIETLIGKVTGLTERIHEEVQNNSQYFDDLQNKFESLMQQQNQLRESLRNILSIDQKKYDVSPLYKNQIYIASKKESIFNLHDKNEVCKSYGGYLVEFDDQAEQKFVSDFIAKIGPYLFFTGGNDEDEEGNYIYYTSKKPVINVKWNTGEPNNYKGIEDCVNIRPNGLNDNICDRNVRYICEIPLV